MNRRTFLAGLTGLGVSLPLPVSPAFAGDSAEVRKSIRPSALRPGDTVGLITPSTAVSDPDRIAAAKRTIDFFGLRVKMGKYAGKRVSNYAASVQERLDDLHAMFADPDIKGIVAVRGGYGSSQILDRIDYELVRKNPKIIVGYSDVTALLLALHKLTGLVTFHGPVAISSFPDYTQACFRKALFQTEPMGILTNPPEENQPRLKHPLRVIRRGRATGPLIGGNLSLIAATMGTPYEMETSGKILFLEDVDEQPYTIDRMLTQLRLAGKFKNIAGLVFGECADCGPRDYKPSFVSPYSLGEVLDNLLGELDVPVLSGLAIGHTDVQLTLPLGVPATLDTDRGTLEIHEPCVV